MVTEEKLREMQAWPLEKKVGEAWERIDEFYKYYNGKVYVSFSGGKDSTVLLHIARELYPDIPAVFVDTGLEYPEIREFVKTIPDVTILRPKMSFKEVVDTYGYPVASKRIANLIRHLQHPSDKNNAMRHLALTGETRAKHYCSRYKLANKWVKLAYSPYKVSEQCCTILKKKPVHEYEKLTGRKCIVGIMASDSNQRKEAYLKTGCNSFGKRAMCRPLSFWTEQDVWDFIKEYGINYSRIYDQGYDRTGCIFCMFGITMEKTPNRFQMLAKSHPKLWEKGMQEFKTAELCEYLDIDYKPIES